MGKRAPTNAAEAMTAIRKLLADWLDASHDARQPVAQIMRLLELVDQELHARPVAGRSSPRDQQKPRYRVEAAGTGEVLTEGKGEGAPPFRVPKAIYDAVAEILAQHEEPLRFEDITNDLIKMTGTTP